MVLFMKSITAHAEISIVRENGKLVVSSGDQLFTQYIYADENRAKPVFYPIIGPNGNEMTRSFPFENDKEGEEADHPHHVVLLVAEDAVEGLVELVLVLRHMHALQRTLDQHQSVHQVGRCAHHVVR